jgi:hypothetical protein
MAYFYSIRLARAAIQALSDKAYLSRPGNRIAGV